MTYGLLFLIILVIIAINLLFICSYMTFKEDDKQIGICFFIAGLLFLIKWLEIIGIISIDWNIILKPIIEWWNTEI